MRKILSYIFGWTVLAALVLGLSYRDAIKQTVISYLTQTIEEQTGYQIKCEKVQLFFPLNLHMECVQVASGDYPLIYADNLELHITPWGLLRRHLAVDAIKIGTLTVLNVPTTSNVPSEFSWNMLPGHLKIDKFQIDRLHISPLAMASLNLQKYASFVSEEIPMRILGKVSLNPYSKTIYADLTLSESAQPLNQTLVIASLEQHTDRIDANFRITETDHGIIADYYGLPRGYLYQGIVHISGEISSWQHLASSEMSGNSVSRLNLETAVQGDEVMQDFNSESLVMVGDHSQMVKAPTITSDYGLKDGVNLSPSTAVSRLNGDFQITYNSKELKNDDLNPVSYILGNYGFLKGPFTYSPITFLSIPHLDGMVGNMLVKGKGFLNGDQKLDGTVLQVSMRNPIELEKLIGIAAKDIKVVCNVTDDLLNPNAELKLSCSSMDIKGNRFEQVSANGKFQYFMDSITGTMEVDCLHKNIDWHGSSAIAWNVAQNIVGLSQLRVVSDPMQFSGNLQLDLPKNTYNLETAVQGNKVMQDLSPSNAVSRFNGQLEGHTDLKEFKDLIGLNASGSINWKAHFFHELDEATQTVEQLLDVTIHSDEAKVETITLDHPIVKATLKNPLKNISGMVSLKSAKTSLGKLSLIDLNAETVINTEALQWPFSIRCKQGGVNLESRGSWIYSTTDSQYNVDLFNAQIENYTITLQSPFSLHATPDHYEISPLFFSLGNGSLFAYINKENGYWHAKSKIENFPLALLELIKPNDFPIILETAVQGNKVMQDINSESFVMVGDHSPTVKAPTIASDYGLEDCVNLSPSTAVSRIKGNATGEISLEDSVAGILGKMHLNLSQVEILKEPLITPAPWQATVDADLKQGSFVFTSTVKGIGPHPLEIAATLPIICTLDPLNIEFNTDHELAAHLSAKGDIESLLEIFLPVTKTNLRGKTSVAIDVKETLSNPNVTGNIDLVEGTFELLDIHSSVKNIDAHFDVQGNKLIMTKLTADGESGSIVGSGVAEFDLTNAFPFDFNFQLNQVHMRPITYANLTASGPIQLKGNMNGAVVKGKIITDSFNMTIPEQIPELMHEIKVTYINQPVNVPSPTIVKQNTSDWPLSFDLEIEVPSKGMINGRDWTSEWKGSAALTGDSNHLLLNGTCKVMKGQYHFNGKSFEISDGTIIFAGDPKKKTSLYVIASKDIETIHVEAILKGEIGHTAIVFRSNPPMSQREIISWILFNRGTSEISSFQGSQLNDSIISLGSGDSQPDMLTKIRDKFGVDKIDFCNDDNGANANEVSFQVGKYISQGVLISIQKSITAEANRLAIEASLLKNFKIQAEVGDDSDGQLKLKWKKDY